jgi:hypothetical protein
MIGPRFRRRRRRGGQALVEFALVAPIFIFALLCIIEFGRAVYSAQMLHTAAREGARYAIVHGSASFCPSGPMPGGQANACDPLAENVKQTVKDFAGGIVGSTPGDFVVTVCWTKQHDLTPNSCPDDNSGNVFGEDEADNQRGSAVQVIVTYSYLSLLSPYVPLPPFVIQGDTTLVVNF